MLLFSGIIFASLNEISSFKIIHDNQEFVKIKFLSNRSHLFAPACYASIGAKRIRTFGNSCRTVSQWNSPSSADRSFSPVVGGAKIFSVMSAGPSSGFSKMLPSCPLFWCLVPYRTIFRSVPASDCCPFRIPLHRRWDSFQSAEALPVPRHPRSLSSAV